MEQNKKRMLFYYDWLDSFESLTDAEIGRLTVAIVKYAQSGLLTDFSDCADRALEIIFKFLCKQIDRDNESYRDRCEINRENAKKGGAPKGNKNAAKTTETTETTEGLKKQPKQPDKDKDKDKDKDICMPVSLDNNINNNINNIHSVNNLKGAEAGQAGIPTLEEVQEFFAGYKIIDIAEPGREAAQFYSYYQQRSWTVSGKPVHYWVALAESWIRRIRSPNDPKQQQKRQFNFTQREDFAGLSGEEFEKILMQQ